MSCGASLDLVAAVVEPSSLLLVPLFVLRDISDSRKLILQSSAIESQASDQDVPQRLGALFGWRMTRSPSAVARSSAPCSL